MDTGQTKSIKLRFNHIIFWWYYRLVDDHFKQYPIIKSIKLLREHYDFEVYRHEGTCKTLNVAMKEADEYRTKYHDLKMQTLAEPDQIKNLNKMFGTNFTNPDNN